jgi:hypothetical protein
MKLNHERFGFTKKQWEGFKDESREIMVEVARQRGMITYGELATRMTTIQVEPHDMILWEIIGDVARDEEAAKRGLLSVVVVHKHGDMEPGYGFYDLANYFGRNTTDKTKCFIDEMHNVHRMWSVKSAAK